MPDIARLAFLQWLASEDAERQKWYTNFREYYDGDHETQLTARQRKYLQVKADEEFSDNYCSIVVDALAERLKVTGFDCGEDTGQAELLWEWWTKNRMDAKQRITHTAAIRDGDGYVIVEWPNDDDAFPKFLYEPAYDGIEGVKVHYSKARNSHSSPVQIALSPGSMTFNTSLS